MTNAPSSVVAEEVLRCEETRAWKGALAKL